MRVSWKGNACIIKQCPSYRHSYRTETGPSLRFPRTVIFQSFGSWDPISRLVVCAEGHVSNIFIFTFTTPFVNLVADKTPSQLLIPTTTTLALCRHSRRAQRRRRRSKLVRTAQSPAVYLLRVAAHARCRCLQRCGFDQRRRMIRTRFPNDSNEQSYTPREITSSRSKQQAAHPPREHLASPPPLQKSRLLISTKSTPQTRHSIRYLPPQPSRSSLAS